MRTVVEYFTEPSAGDFFDPRKHAVALTYTATCDGVSHPRGEALGFRWFEMATCAMSISASGKVMSSTASSRGWDARMTRGRYLVRTPPAESSWPHRAARRNCYSHCELSVSRSSWSRRQRSLNLAVELAAIA
jgi:hypothetical protein